MSTLDLLPFTILQWFGEYFALEEQQVINGREYCVKRDCPDLTEILSMINGAPLYQASLATAATPFTIQYFAISHTISNTLIIGLFLLQWTLIG